MERQADRFVGLGQVESKDRRAWSEKFTFNSTYADGFHGADSRKQRIHRDIHEQYLRETRIIRGIHHRQSASVARLDRQRFMGPEHEE